MTATLLVRKNKVTAVVSKNNDGLAVSDFIVTVNLRKDKEAPNNCLNYSGKVPHIIAPQVPVQIDINNPVLYVQETW
jgi:hypothetical protein